MKKEIKRVKVSNMLVYQMLIYIPIMREVLWQLMDKR